MTIDATPTSDRPKHIEIAAKAAVVAEDVLRILRESDHPRAAQWLDRLSGLRIRVMRNLTTAAGRAMLTKGIIKISEVIFEREQNEYDLGDTVRHEMAHIMVGMTHDDKSGHGLEWREAAVLVGCTGQKYHDLKVERRRLEKYKAQCTKCGVPIAMGVQQAAKARRGEVYIHTNGIDGRRCGGHVVLSETAQERRQRQQAKALKKLAAKLRAEGINPDGEG